MNSHDVVFTRYPVVRHSISTRNRIFFNYYYFFIVVDFVIHRNETAMGLHVFPILIPPPTSLSTRSL